MEEIHNEEQILLSKESGDPFDLEALAGLCHPPLLSRTAFIGVGNRLWGDDGAGPELLDRLKGKWETRETPLNSEGQVLFIDAGELPEDWLIRVIDLNPDVIVLIDAMDLHAEPGSVALLEPEALPEHLCYSTHRLSLRTLLRLWEKNGSKAFVLAIQPKDRMFREGLSPEVQTAIEALVHLF